MLVLSCLFFSFINIFPYQVFESLTLSIILYVVASVIPPGTTNNISIIFTNVLISYILCNIFFLFDLTSLLITVLVITRPSAVESLMNAFK